MELVERGDDILIEQVITVSGVAREKVVNLRDDMPEGPRLGLRLSIIGTSGLDYQYDLEFIEIVDAPITDTVENHDGLRVIIPAGDVENLRGATLDHDGDGLVLRNPNKPRPFAMDNLVTDGELVTQVQAQLDTDINPSLAAHGGYVELVGVDPGDGTVFLRMGGGCQGCSMSRMTMVSGVQASLKASVEGVSRVVDVTDHTAGSNPYYA